MKENCFINEKSIDEAIKSVKSIEEIRFLCDSFRDPSSLKRYQKERLMKKLIKFSQSYNELCEIKNHYVKILGYDMTHKQICELIEKLVCVAHNKHELEEIKKFAKKNHLMNRYMKAHISKDMNKLFMEKGPVY